MMTGRITADYGSGYRVRTDTGERDAVCPRGTTADGERPAAGDRVHLREEGNLLLIRSILPRTHLLLRSDPDPREENQILSVNTAHALVFLSAARRRLRVPALLERWIALLRGAEIEPAVLVNKIDTDSGWGDWIGELEAVCRVESGPEGIPLFPVSLHTGEGWEPLSVWLNDNRGRIDTGGGLLLAGPSGAGKSTFVNRLAGTELMVTGGVRTVDGRGRHTTTERRLLNIPGWFTVTDTPGLKELGLPSGSGAGTLGGLYPEISELAAGCRFRDCRHSGEPGCAVQEALARGEIDFRRFRTWLELTEESSGKKKRRK